MFKSVILGAFLALVATAEDICPAKRQDVCQQDVIKGKLYNI